MEAKYKQGIERIRLSNVPLSREMLGMLDRLLQMAVCLLRLERRPVKYACKYSNADKCILSARNGDLLCRFSSKCIK